MKISIWRFTAAMLSGIFLALCAAIGVSASQDNALDYFGEPAATPFEFSEVTVYGDLHDFFGAKTKELLPGDVVDDIHIQLRNYGPNRAEFFLKATPVNREKAVEVAKEFPGKSISKTEDLLEEALVTITYRNNDGSPNASPLYSGKFGGEGAGLYSAGGVSLGFLNPDKYGYIDVKVEIPKELDYSFFNQEASVDWVFWTEELDTPPIPTPSVAPSPTPTPTPTASPIPYSGGGGGGGGYSAPSTPTPTPTPTALPIPTAEPPQQQPPSQTVELTPAPTEAVFEQPPAVDRGDISEIADAVADYATKQGEIVVVNTGLPKTGRLLTYATPIGIGLAALIVLFAFTFRKTSKNR
ncbi:MAG: hypothetical protein LBU32_26210 [Clostridiales bacterium]|jgi:hypothetical protein|nr:hypothetical protein [Clostridiales bacterium]